LIKNNRSVEPPFSWRGNCPFSIDVIGSARSGRSCYNTISQDITKAAEALLIVFPVSSSFEFRRYSAREEQLDGLWLQGDDHYADTLSNLFEELWSG
jgi:hypothetical protein